MYEAMYLSVWVCGQLLESEDSSSLQQAMSGFDQPIFAKRKNGEISDWHRTSKVYLFLFVIVFPIYLRWLTVPLLFLSRFQVHSNEVRWLDRKWFAPLLRSSWGDAVSPFSGRARATYLVLFSDSWTSSCRKAYFPSWSADLPYEVSCPHGGLEGSF